jgi:hypothetical protein
VGRCQCGSGDPSFFDTLAAAIRCFYSCDTFNNCCVFSRDIFWRRYATTMPTRPDTRACVLRGPHYSNAPLHSPHGSTDTLQQGTEEEWLGPSHRGYTNRPSVSNHSLVEFHRRVKKMPLVKACRRVIGCSGLCSERHAAVGNDLSCVLSVFSLVGYTSDSRSSSLIRRGRRVERSCSESRTGQGWSFFRRNG